MIAAVLSAARALSTVLAIAAGTAAAALSEWVGGDPPVVLAACVLTAAATGYSLRRIVRASLASASETVELVRRTSAATLHELEAENIRLRAENRRLQDWQPTERETDAQPH